MQLTRPRFLDLAALPGHFYCLSAPKAELAFRLPEPPFYAASSPTFWISIVGALVTAIAPSLPAIKNNPALEKLRRQKRWK